VTSAEDEEPRKRGAIKGRQAREGRAAGKPPTETEGRGKAGRWKMIGEFRQSGGNLAARPKTSVVESGREKKEEKDHDPQKREKREKKKEPGTTDGGGTRRRAKGPLANENEESGDREPWLSTAPPEQRRAWEKAELDCLEGGYAVAHLQRRGRQKRRIDRGRRRDIGKWANARQEGTRWRIDLRGMSRAAEVWERRGA